jgi:hypothetical protein
MRRECKKFGSVSEINLATSGLEDVVASEEAVVGLEAAEEERAAGDREVLEEVASEVEGATEGRGERDLDASAPIACAEAFSRVCVTRFSMLASIPFQD